MCVCLFVEDGIMIFDDNNGNNNSTTRGHGKTISMMTCNAFPYALFLLRAMRKCLIVMQFMRSASVKEGSSS